MTAKQYTIPSWQGGLSTESRTPRASVVNTTTRPQRSSAANRRYGGVFGDAWLARDPDIIREKSGYLYLRAILSLGELDAIVSVEIAGDTYTQDSPEGSEDYRGDWSDSATWADEFAPPYVALGGEIYKFSGLYYVVKTAFTVTATTGISTPTGDLYRSYFGRVYAGTSVNVYRGTPHQGVDPLMLELFDGEYAQYNETLTGDWYGAPWALAYVTAKLPVAEFTQGLPTLRAKVRGWRCYDPRTGTEYFTRNPALQLATLISSPLIGLDRPVNPVSIIAAADRCEDLFPDGRRIECNIELGGAPTATPNWIESLRAYAGVMLSYEGGEYQFIVDGPRDTAWRIAFGDPRSEIEMIALPEIQPVAVSDRKNVVRVKFTDTSSVPWKETSEVAQSAAVDDQVELPVVQEYRMPGLLSRAQAYRYALERLAEFQLETWASTVPVADEGAAVRVGEVVELTSPNGLERDRGRVLGKKQIDVGAWQLRCREYNPAAYQEP